ncbi:neuropathy target esterase sws isoform X1 [Hetaerina americana]|uniref:neuropathy target esterase sws isoform X1 n=1 Tax=Hetaerina americana TaxID=62018 RepID=UPI003A7F1F93
MDIVQRLSDIYKSFGNIFIGKWIEKSAITLTDYQIAVITAMLSLVIIAACCLLVRNWKNKEFLPEVKDFVGVGSSRPRFRKRDKVLFYGRKMLRKVKSISGQVRGGQGKKRKLVMKFARKLLQLKKESTPVQLQVLEPPDEYLQEDTTGKDDNRVPPDALYMLQSIRVFGHFEKPVFLRLCKHTEIMQVPAGSYLFRIGDQDENVYVVQSGRVNVYITGADGSSLSLKCVKTGESVISLLSFMDVLTGHPKPYKTVSARAVEDSVVVRLPVSAFKDVFRDYPDIFIRVMQIIMVRLQRVTFTALHQYLGLSAELVNPGPHRKKSSPFVTSPAKTTGLRRDSAAPMKVPASNIGLPSSSLSPEEVEASSWENTPPSNLEKGSFIELEGPFSSSSHQRFKGSVTRVDLRLPMQSADPYIDLANEALSPQGLGHEPTQNQNIPGGGRAALGRPDEATLLRMATEAFVKELGLENGMETLSGRVEIREVPAGTYLMREDSHKDVALIYILSGMLTVSQRTALTSSRNELGVGAGEVGSGVGGDGEVHMFNAHHGEVVGGLAVLTGEPSFFTIKAKHHSRIALLSKTTFYSIMRESPKVVLHIAHTVVRRLSPFVRQVDFALDWVFLESGRALYRQGDESDCTYVVLSGRLRSVITYGNGKKEPVSEYGKGDLVGIVEMVTQTTRGTTVMAVRDSELAKLPEGLFNAIKLRYPIVVTRLITLLGHRILGSWQKPSMGQAVDARPSQVNFSTVAIVPVTEDCPLTAFTLELYHALCVIGPTLRLTSEVIRKSLGTSALDVNNEYRLTSWLAQQEDQHRIALYQCDTAFTPWTQRCVRQADCVLILALADKGPCVGKMEKEVERLAIRTQKELVLLHREGGERPTNTVEWLNMRSWVSCHHHIQCPKRMFSRKSQHRLNEMYAKVLSSEPNVHSDFSRLARWLTGTSVGLVLGGGGARGAAHVGMIKAILEAGIPIDMVGGVSIGAFMGALWCMEKNITTVTQKAREWSKKMTQWWRQIMDLTYPVTSMFSGRGFNQTIQGTFGDTHLEDLWLPYFTVTTDISASSMRIHTHGSLWRYVRASMSLSGYMPPLCDPTDGHLLLDGGYVNNLPADVMRSQGARHILAIDVGSQDDIDLTNYGDFLSGWWLLWKRWNPFATPVSVPTLPDIQSRLAYVSCVRQLEEVKSSDYCEYIRPPIDKYKTLQFGSFDEIKEVGYNHARTYFAGLMKAGALFRSSGEEDTGNQWKAIFQSVGGSNHHSGTPIYTQYQAWRRESFASSQGGLPTTNSPAQYTFTDLAQMVCKVSRNKFLEDEEDEEEETDEDYDEDFQEMGYASEPGTNIMEEEDASGLRRRAGGSLSLSENELESGSESGAKG